SGRLFHKAGNTPVVYGCDAAFPKRWSNLVNPHGEAFSCHLNKRVTEEPAVFISFGIAKVAARAWQAEICNAVEVCVQHLMKMPGKHKLHSVAQQKLVNRRLCH